MECMLTAAPPAEPVRQSSTPLAIVLVCTQPLWHGGEEQAALLAEGLVRRGHVCRLLARRDSQFARRMATRGFDVVTFVGRGRSPQALWQIRRQLRAWQPDVLHMNDPHAVTAAGVASLGLSIPLRVAARRVDFPLVAVSRYHRFCDRLICVSHAVRQVCQRAGVAPEALHVVHDGVDPARSQSGVRARGRAAIDGRPESTILLTVAKLTDHKGHDVMLEALPEIVRRRPDVVWAVAGDGPLREMLEQRARQLNLLSHVRFLGYRRDVPDLMAAADLLVVPSRMEGLCSSIVDAMLAGLPVVATRAGGIPDLLDESSTSGPAGWLVPPDQPASLAAAVVGALDQPSITAQYRITARQRALSEFTAERMVERTIDVYRRALARRSALATIG